jgi:uncharacterized protein YdiU (UPF0061 family)
MPISPRYRPEMIHRALGEAFFDVVAPANFPLTTLRYRNRRWDVRVGLDTLSDTEWLAHFGRFQPLPGGLEAPLALRYHGHQFRSYNPDLGDGRGFLFGQVRDDQDRLLDLGTKGSGQTPWSRRGDGRLTLKGGVREVLATAMLEALGVNTSKSFSLIETGEALHRYDEPSPTRASVLVRLSHSHIRIGSFQRLLAHNDVMGVETLTGHCVTHYLPEARRETLPEMAAAFLGSVLARTASTAARWFAAGFVHGVLNTDNINITGESFDYGPYRFLPHYDPGFTAAYFDENGLYAFGRQPDTIAWNLGRLAECLSLIAPLEILEPELERFGDVFWRELRLAICRRLGVLSLGTEEDDVLIRLLFGFLKESKAPFEAVMFDLHGGPARLGKALAGPRAALYAREDFTALGAALGKRQPSAEARLDHPYFQGSEPVTLVYDEIEALWAPIAAEDDWRLFEQKLADIDHIRQAYGFAD